MNKLKVNKIYENFRDRKNLAIQSKAVRVLGTNN